MHDRRLAAILLSEIAPAAEEAIPALLEAANDEDDSVSEMVVSALDQIDLAQGGEPRLREPDRMAWLTGFPV